MKESRDLKDITRGIVFYIPDITIIFEWLFAMRDDRELLITKRRPQCVSSWQIATRCLANSFTYCRPDSWLSRKQPDRSGPDVPFLALQACILLDTAVSLTTPAKRRCHILSSFLYVCCYNTCWCVMYT